MFLVQASSWATQESDGSQSSSWNFREQLPDTALASSTQGSITSESTASSGWLSDTLPESIMPDADRSDLVFNRFNGPLQHRGPYYYTNALAPPPPPHHLASHLSADPRYMTMSPPRHDSAASSWQMGHPVNYAQASGFTAQLSPDGLIQPKRGRGRPRKLPFQAKPVKQPGQKGQRSKTGCVTCRKRKKKCDERKPICMNCQKNGKVCEGYPTLEPMKKPKAANRSQPLLPPGKMRQKVREKVRKSAEEDKNEDDRDREYEVEHGQDRDARSADIDDDHDNDDDNEDDGEDNSEDDDEHSSESGAAEVDRRLLANFNEHASKYFPPWQHKPTAFRDVLEPLARQHKGVRSGLLCLSAQHMLQQKPEDRLLQDRYMVHLGKAVRYSIDLYEHSGHSCTSPNPPCSDAYIALALIFCLAYEISSHDSFEGVMHGQYSAVAHMAVECPQKSTNEPFQSLLADMFLSHNNIALVTSINRGVRNTEFKLLEFVGSDAVTLFGGAHGLWVQLSNINAFRQRMRDRGGVLHLPKWPEDLEVQTEAQTLEARLLNGPIKHKKGSRLHVVAMLYRASTLVYLYRSMMPSRPHDKMSATVNEGLVNLDQLMQEPATQGELLLPLFLLGCAAFEQKQQRQISDAFEKLVEQPLNAKIQRAYNIVKAIWKHMDQRDEQSWDWEALAIRCGLLRAN